MLVSNPHFACLVVDCIVGTAACKSLPANGFTVDITCPNEAVQILVIFRFAVTRIRKNIISERPLIHKHTQLTPKN